MAGPEIRESVTVAGRAERARVARAFAGGVLGPGHPCGDDAALLVRSCSAIVSGIAGRALCPASFWMGMKATLWLGMRGLCKGPAGGFGGAFWCPDCRGGARAGGVVSRSLG